MIDRAEALFNRAYGKKGESHWVLCFASYLMNGNTAKMAQEHNLDPQTIRNYAKTYRLYRFLRWWAGAKSEGDYGMKVRELRQLRRDVHYSNWLAVAQRVYHEEKPTRIDPQQALDFLRAGSDVSARMFAGIVGGNDMTRTKAYTSALNGLRKVLNYFPDTMTKRDRHTLKKALKIIEKRR